MVDERPVLREGAPWNNSVDLKAMAERVVRADRTLATAPSHNGSHMLIAAWGDMLGMDHGECVLLAHQIVATAGPVTAHVAPF